ncbi:hypothetical protein THRCLA_21302 [Thraustotheca clavata]|uniref:Regulator of chromosome condensation (RCC1) n=1 Tax=Thraustotheca clavata TaxID=74557 RepID=A0A1V9ZXY7_9STRA|nr:hypothetical protein THRCLA_21302 [Thraustotheca clavata]
MKQLQIDKLESTSDSIEEVNPFPPNFFDTHKAVKVTFGDWYGGALTSEGKVFTWGKDLQHLVLKEVKIASIVQASHKRV